MAEDTYDSNCKTCVKLHKKTYRRKTCAQKGITEFNKACDKWEPDLENLSENLQEIKDLMLDLSYTEIQTIYWLAEDFEESLKTGVDYKIGNWVWYKANGKLFRFQVQNIREDFVFGITQEGQKFRVLPDSVSKLKPQMNVKKQSKKY